MLVILVASCLESAIGWDIGKGKIHLDNDCIRAECWCFGWSVCFGF